MNWKGFERKWSWPDHSTIPLFPLRNKGKSLNISVRMADVLAKIRTKNLLNTDLDRCRYSKCRRYKL
jgi:hypothetical protein